MCACACVRVCARASMHTQVGTKVHLYIWRSEDNWKELVLFSHHVELKSSRWPVVSFYTEPSL